MDATESTPSIDAQVEDHEARIAALERRLDKWAATTYSAGLLLGSGARLGDRVVGPRGFDRLANQIASVTGADDVGRQLQVAYRSLFEAEARCVGRIAGSTSNILGKLVTTRLLATRPGSTLEIGTLFGVFAGALMRELARHELASDLTVIDPLEGVQLQPGHNSRTDVSGSPVSIGSVEYNLRAAGLSPDRYRILRGYSTTPDIRAQAADRKYSVIVVDGDHSYEGVAADLDWVVTITAPEAIIVMDDYGDARWPGVRRAVDEHLAAGGRLALRGVVSTSAFLQATGPAGSASVVGGAVGVDDLVDGPVGA